VTTRKQVDISPADHASGSHARSDVRTMIRSKYASLSKSHQRIADYILNHSADVMYLSITELAERVQVGEATISRFCWILDLKGFQDLKLNLAQENAFQVGLTRVIHEEPGVDSLTRVIAQRITRVVENTIQTIDEAQIERACELLAAARKIDFYGVASSGAMAVDASQMFLGIGKLTTAYTDPHIQVMSAALLTNQDVAVAFSHSGSTKDTVTALRRARMSGAFTISITSFARSPITQVSDLVLLASVGETVVITSIYSKIGELIVMERLYAGCVMKMKEAAETATQKITEAVMDKIY